MYMHNACGLAFGVFINSFDVIFVHFMTSCLYAGSDCCSLANIFGKMEEVKEELKIEDYSVSQTTLDQVRQTRIFCCMHLRFLKARSQFRIGIIH